jgi:hypothetical protein
MDVMRQQLPKIIKKCVVHKQLVNGHAEDGSKSFEMLITDYSLEDSPREGHPVVNARPHTARTTLDTIETLKWDTLMHPPYSPDIAPSDLYLFRSLDNHLRGKL